MDELLGPGSRTESSDLAQPQPLPPWGLHLSLLTKVQGEVLVPITAGYWEDEMCS